MPSRGSVALVVVTVTLLGALVWGLSPSKLHFVPAPLRPVSSVCSKGPEEFTPTNLTEIPDLPLEGLGREQKNQALLRLNMEPCPCGCGESLAACRYNNPACETSKELAKKVVDDARGEPAEKR